MSCSTPQCVLAIDDSPVVLALIEARLRPEAVRIVTAASGEEGLLAVLREKPDLVLLDVEMPGLGGLDVCRRLKGNPLTASIPVIFLTATDDIGIKVDGFDLGAHDYVMKPFHPDELRARVRAALRMKRAQDLLFRDAQVDALTGYRTRAFIEARLRDELVIALRDRSPLSVIRIELDHLRSLIDTFGYPFGDAVLQRVCGFAARSIPDPALACRFGGDELLFLLPNTPRVNAEAVARAIREGIRSMAVASRGRNVVITVTGSVVEALEMEASGGAVDVAAILEATAVEMRAARREGRDRVRGGTGHASDPLAGEALKADRESDARAGTVLLDRYVVDRKIGQGGMGTVYRAMHLELGEPVAVKFLRDIWKWSEEHNARFRREAALLARLRHPGIVSILDYGELDEEPFMVMELVRGRTLDEVLASEGVPSRGRVSRIFGQLLEVLAVAHDENVVHRDMKPENVMLLDAGEDRIKVLDFGIAMVADRGAAPRLTRTGDCRGTAHYMAPEQWKGTGVGPKVDVYALGVMLFEALSGGLPFDAAELPPLMIQHVFGEIPELVVPEGGVAPSPALREVVRRMLAKNADERPTTAELRKTLPGLLDDVSAPALREPAKSTVAGAVAVVVEGG